MIDVIVVEDKRTIREGLAILINGTEGYRCVATYANCEDLLEKALEIPANVVLMDIGLPGMTGIEGNKRLKEITPNVNILMLTIYEDNDNIFEALCAGACGYLTKQTPPARLLEAIKDANENGSPMNAHIARKVVDLFNNKKLFAETQSPLTSRETEILSQLAEGSSYQEIGDALFLSISTVRYHIGNIYRKLHVHSQSGAVAKALRRGFI